MANQYVNKVIYNGQTLIDLTDAQVTQDQVLKTATFYLPSGEKVQGTCDFDTNTTLEDGELDLIPQSGDLIEGKVAFIQKTRVTGSMPNRGKVTGVISDKEVPYTIQNGYHDGSGTVSIDEESFTNLVKENIRENVTILGITGTMTGSEDTLLQEKTVDAPLGGPNNSGSNLTVVFDAEAGYTGLSKVIIKKVPYTETPNGLGLTVTIG